MSRILLLGCSLPFVINSLFNEFVHDDIPAIVRNRDVQGTAPLLDLLLDDYWGKPMAEPTSHKSYRPLTVFSFRLNTFFFGPGPLSFHAVNIILHLAMIDRLYRALLLLTTQEAAFFSSLLFAVHPIHSEAVANCVGRAEILSAHLVLSAIQSRQKPLLSGLFTLLAMMAKESGVMCLVILVAVEIILLFRDADATTKMEERLWDLVTSKVLVWAGFFIIFSSVRLLVLQGTMPTFKQADNPAAYAPTQFSRLSTKVYYWFQHYWLLICPVQLCYDWAFGTIPIIRDLTDSRVFYVGGYVLVNLVLAFYGLNSLLSVNYRRFLTVLRLNKSPYVNYLAILLLLVPFIPCLNLFFIVGFAVAERVMYIPSMGFCILIVSGAFKLAQYGRKQLIATLWLTVLFFGAKNIIRNNAWQTKSNLFESGLTVHQNNAKMFYNLANYHFRHSQDFTKAKTLYYETIRLEPKYAQAFNNLASIYEDEGIEGREKAEVYYRQAIAINKHNPKAYTNLARLLTVQNKPREAVKVLLKCSEINADKDFLAANLKLAKLMQKRGHYVEAEKLFQNYVIKDWSGTGEPFNQYGIYLTEVKRYEDAIKLFERAIEIDKDNIDPLLNLGWIYYELDQLKQSLKIYERALQIKPTAQVYNRLALVMMKLNKDIEAVRYQRLAAELAPGDPEIMVHQAIGMAKRDVGEAIKLLTPTKNKDPHCHHPNVHLWLARMYAQKEKIVLANSCLEPCLANEDLDAEVRAEVYNDLGSYLNALARDLLRSPSANRDDAVRQGRDLKIRAIHALQTATELKPGDADIRVKLAQVYFSNQQIQEGEETLRKALIISPNHKEALSLQERVKLGKEKTKEKLAAKSK